MTDTATNLSLFRICSLCGGNDASRCVRCELAANRERETPAERADFRALSRQLFAAEKAHAAAALQRLVDEGTARVALISCSSQKSPGRHAAQDLYCSPLFKKSLAWARRNARHVFILSALHGLVELEQQLDCYDQPLGGSGEERRRWALDVSNALERRFPAPVDVEVTILAGGHYADALVLPRGWRVTEPLRGLQVGERLAWFNREAAS